MTEFRDRAAAIARTAQRIAHLRGASEEAEVLAVANARLIETGYDDFRGETDFYTLALEVPIELYAAIEARRDDLEKSILKRIKDLTRTEAGVAVTQVVVGPKFAEPEVLEIEDTTGGDGAPASPAFWAPGHFRLFISHPSQIKASVHKVKAELVKYQIAAFVAHDDIEPTKEWEAEIESALRTMDALTAFLTSDFVSSRWCDQEVGVAVGRNKLVVPVCAGANPHGFLGKYQGVNAKGLTASQLANALVATLCRNPISTPRMGDALIERLSKSGSWDMARTTMTLLEGVARLNQTQAARLIATIDDNPEVANAYGVPERIKALVGRITTPPTS